MSNSYQNEIPKARINLRLDLHTGTAQKKTELPLKLLVTGDFSNGQETRVLSEREKVMALKMPYLPGDGKYDLALNFNDELLPIAGAQYEIHFEGGTQLSGVLDGNGYALHRNVPFESATVKYKLPAPADEDEWDSWDVLLTKLSDRET